ncbi:hypothetical protein CN130_10850 [Sinorhizobium meliloti]|uniref:SDH family Clp fold serine proteinase n=1 Tax=Rhizobium meliloti TaxID=382 RepID=UPI000FD81FA3|nr:hypothetical protein [Sinorhizobium meliloti]RVM34219.1 hypothetical protein CN130_10850 [Sinorhizobium meliloti]
MLDLGELLKHDGVFMTDGIIHEREKRQAEIKAAIATVTAKYDADILFYAGPIFQPHDDKVVDLCRNRRRRKNLLVVIDTPGGSADAAYRMARAFQRYYSQEDGSFILFVPRYCKSAGSIIALGSDRVIMAVESELGPIDVQLRKEDEVGERTSGLTPHQALDTLAGEAMLHFKRFFYHLRYDNQLSFTTRMAAELSSQMAIGLMAPIYEQVDPLRMGEIERFVRISTEYGERLVSKNVRGGAVARLAAAYPSHGFVIDREEAKEHIFEKVEKPSDELEILGKIIAATGDGDQPMIAFINEEVQPEDRKAGGDEKNTSPEKSGSRKRTASSEVRPNSKGPVREPRGNGRELEADGATASAEN